jgi:hypothetical protein
MEGPNREGFGYSVAISRFPTLARVSLRKRGDRTPGQWGPERNHRLQEVWR